MPEKVLLDGQTLSLEGLVRVAAGAQAALCDQARARMAESRELVEQLADGDKAVYGINTGFGALAEVAIAPADLARLQRNLVVSHAVGCWVGSCLGSTASIRRALRLLPRR